VKSVFPDLSFIGEKKNNQKKETFQDQKSEEENILSSRPQSLGDGTNLANKTTRVKKTQQQILSRICRDFGDFGEFFCRIKTVFINHFEI
jgi:hypothetical protein